MATKFNNVPGFRATGKGYFNALPDFPATAKNANGIFTNLGKEPGDPYRTMYAFVTSISTGWSVGGSYGQSPVARTFYPTNLTQAPLTINGIVANQYEYDRLVEFTLSHHNQAIDRSHKDTFVGTKSVDFKLLPFRIPGQNHQGHTQFHVVHQALHYKGYITQMVAGHQRFVTAPMWTMSFQVADDMLQSPTYLQGELNRQLYKNYIGLFGPFYKGPKAIGQPPTAPKGSEGFTDNSFWHQFGDPTS